MKFLTHCTGSIYPHPRVDLIEGDTVGAISAHTCDKLITFPRGVFTELEDSYTLFCGCLIAIIGMNTFNMV